MKKIIFFAMACLLISLPAMAQTASTSSTTVHLYKAYISANGDCSSAVAFFDAASDTANRVADASGNYYISVDMNTNPTAGSGAIADGTYNCIIFKMSDQNTFIPSADAGSACSAGTTYTIDVCYDYTGSGTPPSTYNPETGASVPCTAATGTEDVVWVYISTYATATEGDPSHNAFSPPTSNGDSVHGFALGSGTINFTSDMTGTFIFGTTDKVLTREERDGTVRCDMQPPNFGFTAQ